MGKKRLAELGGSTEGIVIAGCLECHFDSSTVRNTYELCPLENGVDVCRRVRCGFLVSNNACLLKS
jgi:hypothetical protein